MNKNLYIISVGPGDKELMTVKALNTISKMDILSGYPQLADFSVTDKPFYPVKTTDDLKHLLLTNLEKKIGLLVTGDAGFFSFARLAYKHLKDFIAEVIPGVSSFQYAFARIYKTYEDVKFFSLHSKGDIDALITAIKSNDRIFILLKDSTQLEEVKRVLSEYSNIYQRYFIDLSLNGESISEDQPLNTENRKISLYVEKR
ncbi:MAG: precorrin-6y C5,15-methyltransferase (decarboxylating) subunit CbiE [Calditerrivibrio sp.]|nr:precorrin-6y C5,15-methyltransferase (decarboxylating) subunit CbiE [Calditerrivibrio sp.]